MNWDHEVHPGIYRHLRSPQEQVQMPDHELEAEEPDRQEGLLAT